MRQGSCRFLFFRLRARRSFNETASGDFSGHTLQKQPCSLSTTCAIVENNLFKSNRIFVASSQRFHLCYLHSLVDGSNPNFLVSWVVASVWQFCAYFICFFAGVNPSYAGVIGGSLPGAKQHSVSPHFVNAQSSTVDSGPKVDGSVDSSNVVALSCSLTDGFLSLAAWVRSSCVMYHPSFILHLQRFQKSCILMQLKVKCVCFQVINVSPKRGRWVESTHVTARAVVLVYGQQSSVTLLR